MNSSRYSVRAASFLRCALALGCAALLLGCRREKITEYRIPKETSGMMARGEGQAAAQPQIHGKIPSGWKQQQPSGMSVASFAIPGKDGRDAEMSVLAFAGSGASDLALINVVRENAHLPPLSEADLSKLVEKVNVAGDQGSLIDFTAATDAGPTSGSSRIMLTVVASQGMTWFFKLSGESALVAEQKPAMLDFLKSVTFTAGGPGPAREDQFASTNPKQTEPSGHGLSAISSTESSGRPAWEIPPGWKEVPPTQMLLAKFAVGGPDAGTDVTVSFLGAAGGGTLANVNRWRNQLGLKPVAQDEVDRSLSSLDVLGGKAMLVDVNGTNVLNGKASRIVAAIWPRGGETWFFKMMGDPAVAERERAAFLKFVQSVRFPNG